MSQPYNQTRAMLAISKASFRAIFRSPSAVVFSFGFPLIFILVFGFIGGGGPTVDIALKNPNDSSNFLIHSMLSSGVITLDNQHDSLGIYRDLEKGRIAAVIQVDSSVSALGKPQYKILTQTSSASSDKYPILRMAMAQSIQYIENDKIPEQFKFITVQELPALKGRKYQMIDFILPGMLGFSLLSAGLFGVAFLFFNLRMQLVLKRFYATPINRSNIVLGEALSRVAFQMITAVVIILVGHYIFKFTLVNGFETFLEMMVLSFLSLIVFMGFGFIISSISKSESSIPPLANLITLPQFLLGGTFFSTKAFPEWLQKICEILPLKQLNDAMRNIAFEGAHLTDCGKQLGILGLWGVIVYAVAFRVFKWE